MADIAGSGNDDVIGTVMTLLVSKNHVTGEPADGAFGTENRVPQGMAAPETLVKTIVNGFFRRVVPHLDLLQDDLALPLDFIGRKGGVQKYVRQQIGHPRQQLGQNLGVIADIVMSRNI